jgi:hypothetical protein
MAEFHFDVVQTQHGVIIIEADDYEQAIDEANDIYQAGAVSWVDTFHELTFDASYL